MVALAESKEEVLEILKKDIYAESGVWDFGNVGGNVGGEGNWIIADGLVDPDLSF